MPERGRYFSAIVEDSANDIFYFYDTCGAFVSIYTGGGSGAVTSVNGKFGAVTLVTDDISDASSTNKYITAAQLTKLNGIDPNAQANTIFTVNGQFGDVILNSDDISDTGETHKFVTAADITKLGNLSGTNTGDQDLSGLVPITRTINTKPLNANIVLNQDEVLDGTTYKQYSQTEKTKVAGIASGATANSSDATLLARANHTGSQLASTISDFDTAGWSAVPATAGSAGVAGQRAYESGFLYICVATNTWERVVLATF